MSGGEFDYPSFTDFCAAVKRADYADACRGDASARIRIAEALDGVDLYHHAGPAFGDDFIWVTLADLLCHRIIPRVTLHKDG